MQITKIYQKNFYVFCCNDYDHPIKYKIKGKY
jgi:hypothetical protein